LEVLVSETAPPRAKSLHPAADVELARLARALAHPARVRIVRLLARCGECVCGQIVLDLPLAQATVSQHLKVLKEAGIIRGQMDGPRVGYCLDPKVLKRVKELIGGL
jgi:ArsR family transcriptional regulator